MIAVGSTVGVIASIPGQTMGVSVFTDSLIEATGLSRLAVSQAYLVGTLLSGFSLPFAGAWLDRRGARLAGWVACLGLGVVLAYLSQVDRLIRLFGADPHPLLGAALLTLGFFGLRFTGQGLLTMTSRTMLGRWFEARRGMVAGLSGIIIGFAFGATPWLFDAWIRTASWRGAWLQMAVVIAGLVGTFVAIFYRNDPESCGLRMDGVPAPAPEHLTDEPAPGERRPPTRTWPIESTRREFTRREAVVTSAFWAVTACLAMHALLITGITFHIVDIAAVVGVSRTDAVQIFLPMAVVSVLTAVVGGTLGDRLPVRFLLVTMMLGLGLGSYGAANIAERAELTILGLGISSGLFSPVSTIAYPRFFGRRHLGAIVGVEMMTLVVTSALGPAMLATSRALWGDYQAALAGALALPAASIVLSLAFRAPAGPLDATGSSDGSSAFATPGRR